ncbi:MAG: endolytic transglycosylase MltG [candidate division WOR-3 bacterium]|nr:MAG: endolytic transglycosylase MltG [candidate division WOR-3 bacterium]
MNRKLLIFGLILVIVVVWWQPLNLGRTEVTIPDNANAREIAVFLAEHEIVRNVDEFLLLLKVSGQERELKAGIYELYKYKNPLYLINQLRSGGRSEVIVTIPEGSTIYETGQVLAAHGLVDYVRFVELCSDDSLIHALGLDRGSLEGYLFPDTYSMSTMQNEESVIAMMVRNFQRRIPKYGLENDDSLHRAVIIASIVEREAKYEDERPIIARVFLNRMKSKRPLESCATIFYILKTAEHPVSKQKLTDQDLMVNSPYNTYLHLGLPPGPICSPGESSIMATVSPADVDYLYFVAKGDGRHHFSRTYREHALAKERYQ